MAWNAFTLAPSPLSQRVPGTGSLTVTRVADAYAPARPPCSAAPHSQRIAVSDHIGILETTTFSHFDWVLGFEVESGHVTSLFENYTRTKLGIRAIHNGSRTEIFEILVRHRRIFAPKVSRDRTEILSDSRRGACE